MQKKPIQERETGAVPGRNPVAELLRSGQPVDCIYIQDSEVKGSLLPILAKAREKGVPIKRADSRKLAALADGVEHQGVVALVAAFPYLTLQELLERAGDTPFLVIADEVEDPHNLGAILRTAEAAGAHGLVLPKRRGVGLTPTVVKTSAGAAAHLPVARVTNLVAAMEELKRRGVWIYGADMQGERWCQTDLTGPLALVIGSEGRGLGRLVRERCDGILSLPMCGKVNSLNASVAAGILLYEAARQRLGLAAR